ncbi:MAG: hypothetical protein MZV65_35290 [Chromatiales bacterium]|nr:hypothetical protein [Chromatiales bacterium]
MTHALLVSVFVIASCGLVYELIAGTLASYLLGDSVTAVLHHHRHLPVRDGNRLLAVALRRAPGTGRPLHRTVELAGRADRAAFPRQRCSWPSPTRGVFRLAAVRAGAARRAFWSGWRSRW